MTDAASVGGVDSEELPTKKREAWERALLDAFDDVSERAQNSLRISGRVPAGLVPVEEGLTTTAASSQTASHRHEAGGEIRKLLVGGS